ncbi:MAG: hypothetical protein ACXWWC_03935 [Chitinophagaceae bacterium]
MKILKLLSLLLFVPLVFHAQKSLTGLWIGTLSNDSTTVRKDQSFEIALTEYRGKVYGYSRSTFIVNDTLYYILKRVKGTIDGEICEIKDDEIVSYNFRGQMDKGVKVTTTFRKNTQDSAWYLAGEWKTNKTKKFYSVSGKVALKEETNYEKSKIFPHLEELKVDKEIEFYAASKKPAAPVAETKTIAAVKKEDKQQVPSDMAKTEIKKSEPPVNKFSTPLKKEGQPLPVSDEAIASASIKKPDAPANTIATDTKKEETIPATEETIASSTIKKSSLPASSLPAEEKKNFAGEPAKPGIKKPELAVKINETIPAAEVAIASSTIKKSDLPASSIPAEQKKNVAGELAKPEIKKQELAVKINETIPAAETIEPKTENKKTDLATLAKSNTEKKVIVTDIAQPAIKIPTAAAFIQQRKTVAPQIVEFKSDSLELRLYDNGEIDGDTVSVLLNGEILLAKQGLKASAIKKTIYIQPGTNEINLVLYAENLGKYPPNTGLLVVQDGEDVYQIRFSADLQQNAGVVFRRKK